MQQGVAESLAMNGVVVSSTFSSRRTDASNTVFTRCDRRGDRSRDRSPRRSHRVNTP